MSRVSTHGCQRLKNYSLIRWATKVVEQHRHRGGLAGKGRLLRLIFNNKRTNPRNPSDAPNQKRCAKQRSDDRSKTPTARAHH